MTELRDAIEDLRLAVGRACAAFEAAEVEPLRARYSVLRRLTWAGVHVEEVLETLSLPEVRCPVRTVRVEEPQAEPLEGGTMVPGRDGAPSIWLPPPGWSPASREKTKRAKGSTTVSSSSRPGSE